MMKFIDNNIIKVCFLNTVNVLLYQLNSHDVNPFAGLSSGSNRVPANIFLTKHRTEFRHSYIKYLLPMSYIEDRLGLCRFCVFCSNTRLS